LNFLAALQFLTILPIKRSFSVEQLGRSTSAFPLVGLLIGILLTGISFLLDRVLPASVVNILLIAGFAICSGGLHLDGLADTMDGMAGHRSTEQRLEIMRDSRIGGFGAVGVALFLLIELVLLNNLQGNYRYFALISAPVLSRWAMVNAIFVYPYARKAGLGKSYKDFVNWRQFAVATVIALAAAVLLFQLAGIIIILAVWVIINLLARFFSSRLNGLTGDTYGFINEAGTAGVFLIVVLLSYNHWFI
jgi:adenosylcobinamide-GDP ribazoletransferase